MGHWLVETRGRPWGVLGHSAAVVEAGWEGPCKQGLGVWVHHSRCAAQRVCMLPRGVGRAGSSLPRWRQKSGSCHSPPPGPRCFRQWRWYLGWRAVGVKFWEGILSTTREQNDGARATSVTLHVLFDKTPGFWGGLGGCRMRAGHTVDL